MADQTLARFVNERSILSFLRKEGQASRAAIARALGLTPATITRLTSDMLGRGLLREVAGAETALPEREPGRPGIGIEVDPEGACFLGVEVGVSVLRVVVMDLGVNVAEQQEIPLTHRIAPQEAAEIIATMVNRYRADPRFAGKIHSGGVTLPGLVTNDGYVVNLPILGWTETNFQTVLQDVTDLGFGIENNANAAAFGAVYTRPDTVSPCTVFLKLGTGCGGATILHGRLLRGADGTAMEVGHIKISTDGVPCNCGQRGCLETWVNLAALSRSYPSQTQSVGGNLDHLPDEVAAAFDRGEGGACVAVAGLAGHLATGLVSLVNILNPSQVLLGGVMRPVLARCLPDLRAEIAQRIIPGTRMPDVQLSHLGVFECAIGAACVAHHRAFDISHIEIGGPAMADMNGAVIRP